MGGRGDRERFIHVQVDVDIFDHPKAFLAGEGGLAVFLAALAYCRKHQTDGRMPRAAAMALIGGAGASHFDRLIEIGWFILRGEEVDVHNYAKKNQTREEIERSRAEARDRMRRVRSNKHRTFAEHNANVRRTSTERSVSVYDLRSDLGSERSDPETARTRDDENQDWGLSGVADPRGGSLLRPGDTETRDPGMDEGQEPPTPEQRYTSSYEAGIEGALKRPFAMPERQRGELHQAILKHARDPDTSKPLRGETLLKWIQWHAEEFASWVNKQGEDAKFWSDYGPRGMLRWLNKTTPGDATSRDPPRESESRVVTSLFVSKGVKHG